MATDRPLPHWPDEWVDDTYPSDVDDSRRYYMLQRLSGDPRIYLIDEHCGTIIHALNQLGDMHVHAHYTRSFCVYMWSMTLA